MLRVVAQALGRLFCEPMLEKAKNNDLSGLKEVLDYFFKEVEKVDPNFNFSSEIGDSLKTKSKCKVYRRFPEWCSEGCVDFIESFAKTFNSEITVNRNKKQPEADFCEFEFKIKK